MLGLFGGRSRNSKKATGALAEFYRTPAPAPSTPLSELPLLAVDMETTGLKAQEHRILSIGWVPIDAAQITLGDAGYALVKSATPGQSVGESATIHSITDTMLEEGIEEKEAVAKLLDALKGRVLLAHFSALETSFLDAACRRHFGAGLDVEVVDTFAVERRHMERMGTYPRGEDLRLPRVRSRYGLPQYGSHNALVDALACAELYLAQVVAGTGKTLKAMQV
ncbi:exonuclease domain-containing protein [Corynebacterium kozikiae]|uniref:exonuclease domain-containing protein n=1 Tax=Corynebacterium kozikiae TaxID=2968469 RepID=UPI00211C7645|nr:exonuclease domain-containing protein [Corynebacterium sp. 76QC2CO]MCQ9343404.1 exonuclease domain-containing protein [Corynebacterium sp. 76QC2CO]